jgi:hypothetical protein
MIWTYCLVGCTGCLAYSKPMRLPDSFL